MIHDEYVLVKYIDVANCKLQTMYLKFKSHRVGFTKKY